MKTESSISKRKILAIVTSAVAVILTALLVFNSGVLWQSNPDYIDPNETPMGDGLTDDEREARAAEEERETDIADLGYVPGEVVVIYNDDATSKEIKEAVAEVGEEAKDKTKTDTETALVNIDDTITVDTAIETLESSDAVDAAFPNFVADTFDEAGVVVDEVFDDDIEAAPMATGDHLSDKQWQTGAVNAFGAWDAIAKKGAPETPVKVAVLDTGASLTHPDLRNTLDKTNSVEVYWNNTTALTRTLKGDGYMGGDTIPEYSTHGTHVSGIIGGESNNGGILGIASGGSTAVANKLVKVVAIDVFSHTTDAGKPTATANDILVGLSQAQQKGCTVVNMSLGFYNQNTTQFAKFVDTLNNKIDAMSQTGIVVVASAGNDNTNLACYPAACKNAVGVISVSKRGSIPSTSSTFTSKKWETNGFMRSSFSNYGSQYDISAPGEYIYSSAIASDKKTDTYEYMSGTSMAAPVVTGVVALMKAADPELSASDARYILYDTASDLNKTGKDDESGYGLVNAQAAVTRVINELPATQATPAQPQTRTTPAPAKTDSTAQTTPSQAAETTDIATAKISVSDLTYNGKNRSVSPAVSVNGTNLKAGTNFTFSISPATIHAVGTYTVKVTGRGAFAGTTETTFKVTPANLESATIQAIANQAYTGKAITPQPKVTVDGTSLVNGTDFTVSYSNNTNAGTAAITVTGKGNYTGKKTVNFTIVKTETNKWISKNNKKYYYGANGSPVTGSQKIDGHWYFFDGNGAMRTGWVTFANGVKSYFNTDGKALLNWQTISNKRYYFNPSTGKTMLGKQKIGAWWYYFDNTSQMHTDWLDTSSGKSYFNASGQMLTGMQKIADKHYYFNSAGIAVTGLAKIGKNEYFFAPDGHANTGWQDIMGKAYYFNSDGRMKTGWLKQGKKKYYLTSSGAAATGWTKISKKWYYFDNNHVMKTGWQTIKGKKYYLGQDGKRRTGLTTILKKKYYFNKNGVMKTGWQKVGKYKYHFNSSGVWTGAKKKL